jgi:formylmethanofuran--tetrahydromethanopterin N-formyltransferase
LIINNTVIEDTYAELFSMWASRIIVTADTSKLLKSAINSVIGFATSIIMCPCEAGIDTYLKKDKTPDGRIGISVMFFSKNKEILTHVLLERLAQCILTSPTTAVFNGLQSEETTNAGYNISYFGDGWQSKKIEYGREVFIIPMMDGEFIIENKFGLAEGIAGGNFLIMARDKISAIKAAESAVKEIKKIPYTITSFPGGICRSGSKLGSRYRGLGVSINHPFYPSLRGKIEDSKVPDEVNTIYEIVINGLDLEYIKKAMVKGINAAAKVKDVVKITSLNYGGKLGDKKIFLKDLF